MEFLCSAILLQYHKGIYIILSDKINFLGISIVGQSNKRGDGGIYVGSVMKGYVTWNALLSV